MNKKTIRDISLENKKVIMRVDFNVPMKEGKITDDNRIVEAIPTIKYCLEHNAKVLLMSHLGRIKTAEDKASNSLFEASKRLEELLGQKVYFVNETRGKLLEETFNSLKSGEVMMIENTRYEDIEGKKESGNDPELGAYWASLGDVFVNDAFGTAHRAHASNEGIASHFKNESVAGLLLEKEIKYIGNAVDSPVRPFVAILGGSKVSDKISVIENLLSKADKIIIGGAMAYTFYKALGYPTGISKVEEDYVEFAKGLLEKANGKIVLPVDNLCCKEFVDTKDYAIRNSDEMKQDEMGLDIGPKSIELFKEVLKDTKTVVWNGPMGVFEMNNFKKGTEAICEILANSNAITVVGGGDSAAAVISMGYKEKFTHVSTGGGASLEYLEGKVLPGIACLSDK